MAAPSIVNPGGEANNVTAKALQSPSNAISNFFQQLLQFLRDFFQNFQNMLQGFWSGLPSLLAPAAASMAPTKPDPGAPRPVMLS